MIEVYWGSPLTLVVSEDGETKKFTTIEQAHYWLRKKWPVTDRARDSAVERIDAAMNCMTTVGAARKAFIAAAITAGFTPDHQTAKIASGD
jgi:hypothetical protein